MTVFFLNPGDVFFGLMGDDAGARYPLAGAENVAATTEVSK